METIILITTSLLLSVGSFKNMLIGGIGPAYVNWMILIIQ